jgi:hypothetical protein
MTKDYLAFFIGIPTYNRPARVRALVVNILAALSNLKLKHCAGVIVADNSFEADHELKRMLIMSGGQYIHDGKNHGYGFNVRRLLIASRGHYLVLTGDDDEYDMTCLQSIDDYIQAGGTTLYATYSSVISSFKAPPSESLRSCRSVTVGRLPALNFISNYWQSIIFVSSNIMFVHDGILSYHLTRPVSDIYENSVFASALLAYSPYVDVMLTEYPKDSLTQKNYTAQERFQWSLLDFTDILKAFSEFLPPRMRFRLFSGIMLSKLLYCISYALPFSILQADLRLSHLILRFMITRPYFDTSIVVAKACALPALLITASIDILPRPLANAFYRLTLITLFGRSTYTKRLYSAKSCLSTQGMGYYPSEQ